MCVYVSGCVYVCVRVSKYVCECECIGVCAVCLANNEVWVCGCTRGWCVCKCVGVCVCVYEYVCGCECVGVCAVCPANNEVGCCKLYSYLWHFSSKVLTCRDVCV